ncbi:MAG: ATP-binding cassette domain-containing protein [Anaerolineae bacterium]|nr:ATP-binding cassette domain-containing protein [Anaerolineae bacterium]
MIEVENLTRYYGPIRAVHNVNFQVAKGEIVGFLGPNGAGKSTTMRILTGYLPASSGTARIAGFDVFYDSLEVRRRVGYMPETVPLYPEMTVQAYLNFMADLRQLENRKEAVGRAMDNCGITRRARQPISQLSKGYRQRVGLAQAILHDPEVLILDEPTIGLDPRQVTDVRELIREIGQEHTIILSSHILSEVSQTCNRMLIINDGQIVASGTPDKLTEQVQDQDRVLVRIGGASGMQVISVLKRVDSVLNVETIEDGAYSVSCVQGSDNRAGLARAVVEQGWNLLELATMKMSLEEIFLKLTEGATIEDLTGGPLAEPGMEEEAYD